MTHEQTWNLKEILSDDTHSETTDSRSLGRRTMSIVITCDDVGPDTTPEPFQVGHGLAVGDEIWDVAEIVSSGDPEAADDSSVGCERTIVVTCENAVRSRCTVEAPDSLQVGDSLNLVTGGTRFEITESGSILVRPRPVTAR